MSSEFPPTVNLISPLNSSFNFARCPARKLVPILELLVEDLVYDAVQNCVADDMRSDIDVAAMTQMEARVWFCIIVVN